MVVAIIGILATVALPAMGDDLDASTSSLQWVLNAYLLAFAAFQIPAGRFGDIFGRRLVLLCGLAVFGLASFIPAVAPNQEVLIAGRALQGIGAAMLFATSLSLVSGAFPPEERAKGIGIWSGLGVSGAAIGPLLGGVIKDSLGTEAAFLTMGGLALVTSVGILAFVPSLARKAGETVKPSTSMRQTLRQSRILQTVFSIRFFSAVGQGAVYTFLPLYGVAIGISDQFKVPIKYIGVGEAIDKLQIFNKRAFVDSLFAQETV